MGFVKHLCLFVPSFYSCFILCQARYYTQKERAGFAALSPKEQQALNARPTHAEQDGNWDELSPAAQKVNDWRNAANTRVSFSSLLPTPLLAMLSFGLLLQLIQLGMIFLGLGAPDGA